MSLKKSVLLFDQPWANLFLPGTVLWRGVSFRINGTKFRTKLIDVEFERTTKGNYLAKLRLEGAFCWEPEVIGTMFDGDEGQQHSQGLVIFADSLPPVDWTHLVVTGVGKALYESGRPGKGSCVFAKVGVPYNLKDYLTFRKKLFRIRYALNRTQFSFEEVMDKCSDVVLAGQRTTEKRLLISRKVTGSGEVMYFRHLQLAQALKV